MTNMGYHWDNVNKVYFNRVKGSGKIIYNYDDPNEFALVNIEEQLVDDNDHHVDAKMEDTNHGEDKVWLQDTICQQQEDP